MLRMTARGTENPQDVCENTALQNDCGVGVILRSTLFSDDGTYAPHVILRERKRPKDLLACHSVTFFVIPTSFM